MHNGSTIIDLENLVAVTLSNEDSLKINVEREVWKRILFGKVWTELPPPACACGMCYQDGLTHYMCGFDITQPYDVSRVTSNSEGKWFVNYVNGDCTEVPAHAIKHAMGL